MKEFFQFFLLLLLSQLSLLLKLKNSQEISQVSPIIDYTDPELDTFRRSIVSIELSSEYVFYGETSEISTGYGFVVSKRLGLIATTKRISRTSPTVHKLTFYDGSTTYGQMVYYDINNDLALIQINNVRAKQNEMTDFTNDPIFNSLTPLDLGDIYSVDVNYEVLLLNVNKYNSRDFIKTKIKKMNYPVKDGYSTIILTDLNPTKEYAGLPLINSAKQVIGVYSIGRNEISISTPINYLKSAVQRFENEFNYNIGICAADKTLNLNTKQCQTKSVIFKEIFSKYSKGYISLPLTLDNYSNIEANLRLAIKNNPTNNFLIEKFKTAQLKLMNGNSHSSLETRNMQNVLKVSYLEEFSPCYDVLQPGDHIIAIEGQVIGGNFIKFEEFVDKKGGQTIEVHILRKTEILIKTINVFNSETLKIKTFYKYANSIIHEINPYIRDKLGLDSVNGVYVSQIGLGSPFREVRPKDVLSNKFEGNMVVYTIGNNTISSGANFEKLIRDVINNSERNSSVLMDIVDLTIPNFQVKQYEIKVSGIIFLHIITTDEINGGWKIQY